MPILPKIPQGQSDTNSSGAVIDRKSEYWEVYCGYRKPAQSRKELCPPCKASLTVQPLGGRMQAKYKAEVARVRALGKMILADSIVPMSVKHTRRIFCPMGGDAGSSSTHGKPFVSPFMTPRPPNVPRPSIQRPSTARLYTSAKAMHLPHPPNTARPDSTAYRIQLMYRPCDLEKQRSGVYRFRSTLLDPRRIGPTTMPPMAMQDLQSLRYSHDCYSAPCEWCM